MTLGYCDDFHELFILIDGRIFEEDFNEVDLFFRHLYNIS